MILTLKRYIVGILCLILVFLLAIFINSIQFFSLVTVPFSRKFFCFINAKVVGAWWIFCVFCLRNIVRIKLVVTGSNVPSSQNAIIVANHQCWADICVLAFLACDKKMAGYQRWLTKDILKYVPGIGWGLLFNDSIFLKRNWHKDKSYILATFSKYLNEDIPFWLMCFSEGTRRTEKKHERSMRYAERMGLTKTNYVMIPKKKGFVSAVMSLREKTYFILDITIAYQKVPTSIISFFCGETPIVHCHYRKYDTSTLPLDEDKLGDWLIKLYVEKDELLKHFYQMGNFPST